MRFACQSCGKAYNLPEDKIADKSNVKLKCRVCGAIVEVKRHGEVVAQVLGDVDTKNLRVSEAPSPLTSLSMDDADDATHAIAVGDQILGEASADEAAAAALLGHVKSALGQQRSGLASLPPASQPGGSVPLVPNFGVSSGSNPFLPSPAPGSFPTVPAGATPVPPPLLPPEPPVFARQEPPVAPPLPSPIASPPPPLPSPDGPEMAGVGHAVAAQGPSLQNGSNGLAARFGDVPFGEEPLPPIASAAMSAGAPFGDGSGASVVEVAHGRPASDDATRKMLAALATGILIGFIIARLFF